MRKIIVDLGHVRAVSEDKMSHFRSGTDLIWLLIIIIIIIYLRTQAVTYKVIQIKSNI